MSVGFSSRSLRNEPEEVTQVYPKVDRAKFVLGKESYHYLNKYLDEQDPLVRAVSIESLSNCDLNYFLIR